MSLDLERHLVFYGAYHHNKVNVFIHMVCVPLILFTAFLLATNSGTLIPLPQWMTIPNLELNLGTIGAIIWGGLYLLLEPVAGGVLAILCLGGTAFGNSLRAADAATTNKIAVAVHVASWLLQFLGHGVFEGRAPALLNNLVQAIFLAPLFVWLELLFMLGYRSELQARVEKKVQQEIAKFQAKKENGSTKKAQ